MLEKITKICVELISSFNGAREVKEYIDKRFKENIQKEFNIGYFPDNDNLSLITNIIKEEDLLKTNIFYYKIDEETGEKKLKSSLSNHNLVLPYNDAYGKIVALVGRTVLTEVERKNQKIPKYKNTVFSKSNTLFGLDRAKEAIIEEDRVFVVEGQFDCIRAMEKGLLNIVCLGASNMTFGQFAILNRYTSNIVMALDNDEAGKIGIEKARGSFGKWANFSELTIPDGFKDLDEFLLEEGNVAVEYIKKIAP